MEIDNDTPSGMDSLYPLAYSKVSQTYQTVCGMSDNFYTIESGPGYTFANPPTNAITCMAGGAEMLRVGPDGFWVRGQKVDQDDNEAQVVYNAFKAWMAWAQLNRDYK
jgi:hypothetical protein